MEHEVILPAEVTVSDLIDQMARAVWGVLAADPGTLGLYQGYYVTVCAALESCLQRAIKSEQALGRARSLILEPVGAPPDAGLETVFALAVVGRIREVLDDVRAVHLVTQAIPEAIRQVLEPYVWTVPADPRGSTGGRRPESDAGGLHPGRA